jgi:hypothetical protein
MGSSNFFPREELAGSEVECFSSIENVAYLQTTVYLSRQNIWWCSKLGQE